MKGLNIMSAKKRYPECEKMAAVKNEFQAIGSFLDWLEGEDLFICNLEKEEYRPIHTAIEKLLAEYFEIDLDKVEKERCRMLNELRKKK